MGLRAGGGSAGVDRLTRLHRGSGWDDGGDCALLVHDEVGTADVLDIHLDPEGSAAVGRCADGDSAALEVLHVVDIPGDQGSPSGGAWDMDELAVSSTGSVALPNHEPGDDRRA